MKITRVRAVSHKVQNTMTGWKTSLGGHDTHELIFVRIDTDEKVFGIGVASPGAIYISGDTGANHLELLNNRFGPAIAGAYPFDIESIIQKLDSIVRGALSWLTLLSIAVFFGASELLLAASTDPLIGAAKREGEVVVYASMNLGEANILTAKFEERYPFIKVKLNRTGSEKLLTKVLTEARAKKTFADVIQTVEFSMHIFNRKGILGRYISPVNSLYPKEFKEDGYWTTVYYHPYVLAYNTRLVSPAMLPRAYEDLLDPKWKGKIMMEGTKADWFAGMLQIMGQEPGLKYMRELAKQQPTLREGHELIAQLVAAGEGALDINIPASSVDRLKEKGAPIDWTALGAAPAVMVGIGLSAQAAHLNAAKLYMDFVLSREGQKLFQSFGRLAARSDLRSEQPAAIKEIKMVPVNPALAERMDEYAKQLRSILGS